MEIEEIIVRLKSTPFASADLPGLGGRLKARPEHFVVEEIPAYAPCGEGEHVFVTLRRREWNTQDVGKRLAGALDAPMKDVGWAGMKDRNAVTTQTFSVRVNVGVSMEAIESKLAQLPFEFLAISRHKNKLKAGHLQGNRFQIVLSDVDESHLEAARQIAAAIARTGVPNFYGEQRFGRDCSNVINGIPYVKGGRRSRNRRSEFLLSAVQSALFNLWLSDRMNRGDFARMLLGDVAKKTDTGGLFVVDDVDEANRRHAAGKIGYTGPMFGFKMMSAAAEAGEFEQAILDELGLTCEGFHPFRAPGTRRPAVIRTADIRIAPHRDGLLFEFSLPSGVYATVVLREFIK